MSEIGVYTFRIKNCRFRIKGKNTVKCTLYPINECPYNGNLAFLKCRRGRGDDVPYIGYDNEYDDPEIRHQGV